MNANPGANSNTFIFTESARLRVIGLGLPKIKLQQIPIKQRCYKMLSLDEKINGNIHEKYSEWVIKQS